MKWFLTLLSVVLVLMVLGCVQEAYKTGYFTTKETSMCEGDDCGEGGIQIVRQTRVEPEQENRTNRTI